MYWFLVFTTVASWLFTTSAAGGDTCDGGTTNATCQAACLKQPCDKNKWSCNGTLLSTCTQSCYDFNSCTQLACDEMAEKCEQYCFGCQNMKCNSSKCVQQCSHGKCHNMTCTTAADCQQSCNFCRRQRCYETKSCSQLCLESDCSLECLQSQACQQHCHGNGCKASCLGNENCRQTCYAKANCTHLVCDSEFCSQSCANNSRCGLLRCHGEYCSQESYVENSKLECTASICREQVSHVSNTDLTCDNINGSCVQKCFGSGCMMSCGKNVKTCEQYCYGGDCNMSCSRDSDTCTMECPGGNCVFSCKAKHCLLLCENGCTGDNTEDTREECSGNKLLFHPVLFLIFTSFTLSLI
jgi:hypothetical protein